MPRPTPRRPGENVVAYTTRNLPQAYLRRLRILAALRRTTIEDVVNEAIAHGLRMMERERRRSA